MKAQVLQMSDKNGFVIAKYIRLSIDDAVSKSTSITQQHLLLDKHIAQMGIDGASVLEFVDNGYTGTNMSRPALQEMLALARSGRVNCIVVKDFTRFSRNALESGYYIEQLFPLYQIRFISVGDGFDSHAYKNDTGGMDVAFRFILSEYYSQDLSKKVKSSMALKMKNGENIVANPIYGYRKNKQGKWELEQASAAVVREMFELALQGMTTAQIKSRFIEARHPTPKEHVDMQRKKDIEPKYMWTTNMIRHMLRNEQYTGSYVSGKQRQKGIGLRGKLRTDKSEWIVIEDSHPPIVSKEDFERLQSMLPKKIRRQKPIVNSYLLRGKLKCGVCGYALAYGQGKVAAFRCYHNASNTTAKCYRFKLAETELNEAIMAIVGVHAKVFLNNKPKFPGEAELKKQIEQLMEQKRCLYEDLIIGQLDGGTYQTKKANYDAQLKKIDMLLALQKQNNHAEADNDTVKTQKELVQAIIDKIEVYPDDKLHIHFKNIDFTDFR